MAAALPAHAQALLADAFASEVVERLPELQASMLTALAGDDRDAIRLALRHVHTFASSAVVVGEGDISTLARRCEERLIRAVAAPGHDLAELRAAAEDVTTLSRLLTPWLSRGAA
jgi:HPt (histidine-containing phosphotransfer) domain-containing protein